MKKHNSKAAKRKLPKILVSQGAKVTIRKLPTGVPGLDDIMGGGISEFSFNIIAGSPGCGKTTLAHQIVFANATAKKPTLYLTVLGEPAIKMLRYQQQYSFFDDSKLGEAVRFINLSDVALEKRRERRQGHQLKLCKRKRFGRSQIGVWASKIPCEQATMNEDTK